MVEEMAAEKRSARQIVEAVRAYASDRPSASQMALVWIAADSDAGRAWAAHWRERKGKRPPMDSRGGWRFPSLWPPGLSGEK
ncbi:MAG: hypothetical protein ACR652_03900 [Methylocystis sp.]|uniref:hypothetical protein n=1 Tax=Methylocystis sp. TaxID=1911079 RepID=UPI003DA57722